MKLTEILSREHRLIEKVLGALDAAASEAERGQVAEPARLAELLAFLREFADRCHHGKEEDILFRRLGERGLGPEHGPVAVMLYEHELGRSHIRDMGEALPEIGTEAGRLRFARAARAYVTLLTGHIMKEDNILFPMADQVLSEEDQRDLTAAYGQVDPAVMGEQAYERHGLAAERLLSGSEA
jgi:hemerythrin-like domain-containing protein